MHAFKNSFSKVLEKLCLIDRKLKASFNNIFSIFAENMSKIWYIFFSMNSIILYFAPSVE